MAKSTVKESLDRLKAFFTDVPGLNLYLERRKPLKVVPIVTGTLFFTANIPSMVVGGLALAATTAGGLTSTTINYVVGNPIRMLMGKETSPFLDKSAIKVGVAIVGIPSFMLAGFTVVPLVLTTLIAKVVLDMAIVGSVRLIEAGVTKGIALLGALIKSVKNYGKEDRLDEYKLLDLENEKEEDEVVEEIKNNALKSSNVYTRQDLASRSAKMEFKIEDEDEKDVRKIDKKESIKEKPLIIEKLNSSEKENKEQSEEKPHSNSLSQ